MRVTLLFLLCLSLAAAAQAQSDFRVYYGTEQLFEVGMVEKLTVISSNLQFNLRPPKGWSHQADPASHKLIFTNPSTRSAVTILFTTNSPGKLPAKDALLERALLAHPMAPVVGSGVCSTSYQPGVLFELERITSPGHVQRISHAFVPQPDGEVEFILATPDDEFGRAKHAFTDMLRTFRVTLLKPKQP